MHVPELVQEDELNILTTMEKLAIKAWNFVKENYKTLTVCGILPPNGYHQMDDYSCGPIAINRFASLLKEIHDSSKDSVWWECDDGVLLAKIKTPDELKDNNSRNAAEIFKHLLKNKRNAFPVRDDIMDNGKGSKKSSDGTINNPISLDDTPIQLVVEIIEDEDEYVTMDEEHDEKGDGSAHDANTDSKNDVNQTLQTKNTEFQDARSEIDGDSNEEQKKEEFGWKLWKW